MQKLLLSLLMLAATATTATSYAREVSLLFIGNSYTYFPGDEQKPGLPDYFRQVAESIEPGLKLNYSFSVHGGYSFEMHLNNPDSVAKMGEHYDHVVLQGQSMESLELTPWYEQNGTPGVKSFQVYLPKALDLVEKRNSDITLFVNWIWNPHHANLQDNHPGLYFPIGHPRAGQKWCGKNQDEYQNSINASYRQHATGYRVHFALVGTAWLQLQKAGLVTQDELYREGDWSHPSPLGTLVATLVLVRDVLHLDVRKNKFLPPGVDALKAEAIANALSIEPLRS